MAQCFELVYYNLSQDMPSSISFWKILFAVIIFATFKQSVHIPKGNFAKTDVIFDVGLMIREGVIAMKDVTYFKYF